MSDVHILTTPTYIVHARAAVLIAVGLLLSGCVSTSQPKSDSGESRIWPGPPSSPRIAWVTEFSTPQDLGISSSLISKLKEIFTGRPNLHLVRPMAVLVTKGGIYFVADPGAKGVHRFDPASNDYTLVRRKDELPLPSPVALAVSSDDRVYVSDSVLGKLFVIEPGSSMALPVPLDTEPQRPTGIAVDPSSGRFYVVDTASHRILVYSRDGKLLQNIGERGSGDGEFNFPTMVSLGREGEILVADSMNFRVQIFDSSGRFIGKFGQQGDGSGDMSQPKGIAVDPHGHIYVVDSLFHAVQIFDRSGRLLLAVGDQGRQKGEFWLPAGIFISTEGTIYIADSYNHRVQVLRYIGEGE